MRVLFFAHRVPWPPDKGDRLRSYALLRWLARRHEVHLAAFADGNDADEARDAADRLRPLCAQVCIAPRPPLARGALALVTGRAISVEVFSSAAIDSFVGEAVRTVGLDAAVGYSSQTAPTLLALRGIPRVLDMVDVDSEKWRRRFRASRNPAHWLEARRLRRLEERCARELDAVLVTSRQEAALLGGEGPRVRVVPTGLDLVEFSARRDDPGGARIVMLGAMDYPPNRDGALWFAREVLPRIRSARPDAEFVVVGRRPPEELARSPGVTTTGFLDDLRPTVRGCAVAVAPILAAHGVQTKALVCMALGIPTVVHAAALAGLGARAGVDVEAAESPADFAGAVLGLLDNPDRRARLATAGRRFVEASCDGDRNLAVLEEILAPRRVAAPV